MSIFHIKQYEKSWMIFKSACERNCDKKVRPQNATGRDFIIEIFLSEFFSNSLSLV